jgi:hypothetical protein
VIEAEALALLNVLHDSGLKSPRICVERGTDNEYRFTLSGFVGKKLLTSSVAIGRADIERERYVSLTDIVRRAVLHTAAQIEAESGLMFVIDQLRNTRIAP